MSPAKKKAAAEEDMTLYRSRPTVADPFGHLDAPTEGALDVVLARGRVDRAAGLAPVIEYRVPGCPWTNYHPVVTARQLIGLGLAAERTSKKLDPSTGKMVGNSGINIGLEGQRIIYEAMSADPLDFTLDQYRSKP